MCKVISFSLFGNNDLYCQGAIENSKRGKTIYPGWELWFYCSDDVPENVKNEISSNECKVILREKKSKYGGLFWRFEPLYQKEVEVFISRDCDSRINTREKVAVEQWLETDKSVHLMRDAWNHDDLIMAGMFGIRNNLFHSRYNVPDIVNHQSDDRSHDQKILQNLLWPLIKGDHVSHDHWAHNSPVGNGNTDNERWVKAKKFRNVNDMYNLSSIHLPFTSESDVGLFVGQVIDSSGNVVRNSTVQLEYTFRGKDMDSNDLTKISDKYNCCKSHNDGFFSKIYDRYLKGWRNTDKELIEFGVFRGTSLKVWHEYFPNAKISGVDHFTGKNGNGQFFDNPRSFFDEVHLYPRITLYELDQSVKNNLEKIEGQFFCVIDDASHIQKDQQVTFEVLFPKVLSGGVYIIEDLSDSGYGIDPNYQNSTWYILEEFIRKKQFKSPYLSDEGNNILSSMIESVNIFTYPNVNDGQMLNRYYSKFTCVTSVIIKK